MRSTLTMDTLATRATIFLRLKSDDTAARELAWADFRSRYAPIIAGFARKLSVRPQDVDDVIQDVFLGFFSVSNKFAYDPAKGRFRGYLKTVTLNAIRDRFGRRAKVNEVPLSDLPDDAPQLGEQWDRAWEAHVMRRAVEATRAEYADHPQTFEAFERYALKRQPAADVARELGMSESTVYRAKSRVAASMKRRLADLEDSEG